MTMDLPKVSVLIPSYNQEHFIEQTLISSLTQDYENLEVVVTDDASTDNTPQILKELQIKYPRRLKVLLNQENLGVTKNHTRGLLQCGGDFIVFQDGDDLFLPNKIKKQVFIMLERPECTICFHDVDVFNSETGESLYLWSQRFGHREGGIRNLVRYGNYLPSVSIMVRRKDIPAYGYDDRIQIGSDWLLWLEVLSHGRGKMVYIDEVLARYRRHTGNLTNKADWKFQDQHFTLDLIESKWPHLLFSARMRRSEVYFMQALNSVSARSYGNVARHLLSSLLLGFPLFVPWIRLIAREIIFFLRYGNKNDDILMSFISK